MTREGGVHLELYEKDWVRLPLEKAYNVRELGGYPAAGGQTAYQDVYKRQV